MLTLQQLVQPLTPNQLWQVITRQLAKRGIDTTNWKPGAVVRTIFAIVSTIFASFSSWSSASISSMFLTLARGDWLAAKAHYDYSTDKFFAQPASGSINIVNSGPGVYTFDPDDLTFTLTKTNPDGSLIVFTYHNTATISIPSGSPTPTSPIAVPIECETAGTATSIPPGAALTLTPAYGGLTVSVPTAVNGSDDEADQQLINRAQLAASAISPDGPSEAYVAIALGVKRANGTVIATQAKAIPGTPVIGGTPVNVYVGGNSGGITGDPLVFDGTSDLGLINLAIQTNTVPLGQTAYVFSASTKAIAIKYTVYGTKNTTLSVADIKACIEGATGQQGAVPAYFASFPMGGYPDPNGGDNKMFVDSIESVIEQAVALIKTGTPNPIYHATVQVSLDNGDSWTTNDIPFSAAEAAKLKATGIPAISGLVNLQ